MDRWAALGALKLSYYFKQSMPKEYFEKHSYFLKEDITEAEVKEVEKELLIQAKEERLFQRIEQVFLKPVAYDPIALTFFALCALYRMDRCVIYVLEPFGQTEKGITLEMAAKVTFPEDDIFLHLFQMKQIYRTFAPFFLYDGYEENWILTPFSLDDRLLFFLYGDQEIDGALQHICWLQTDFSDTDWVGNTDQIDKTCLWMKQQKGKRFFMQVAGAVGSGRKYFVQQIAKQIGQSIVWVDAKKIMAAEEMQEIVPLLRRIIREVFFSNSMLCFIDASFETEKRQNHFLADWEKAILGFHLDNPRVFFTTKQKTLFFPGEEETYFVFLENVALQDRLQYWDAFARKYLPDTKIPVEELAVKLKLQPGEIKNILTHIKEKEGRTQQKILETAYQLAGQEPFTLGKSISPVETWEMLKVEESVKKVLQDFCDQVKQRAKVLQTWGFSKRYTYGTCPSALFTGPPGTGKTMAARVIAHTLGLQMLQVDLSQVVDKYIGETEKRLEQVFQEAERRNQLLFLDEADALLGKRSEVKEAKDRYANIEVSYLLQRIEQYDGIVLLATNYSENVDAAFLRRIRFVIPFSVPTKEIRLELWKDLFLKGEVPFEKIDFDFLAEQFEITGGVIKNIVLNAAFFAAARGDQIEMKHLVWAIEQENQKTKKVAFAEEFGIYDRLRRR